MYYVGFSCLRGILAVGPVDVFRSSAVKDSNKKMKSLKAEKEATEKRMGKAETEKTQTEKGRGTKKGELDGLLEKINDINPNCEYYEVNYPMRTKNRQIEIDGLNKAPLFLLCLQC